MGSGCSDAAIRACKIGELYRPILGIEGPWLVEQRSTPNPRYRSLAWSVLAASGRSLLREPDPAQQSGIAWVGAEIVQFRVKFQVVNELAFVLSVLRPLASDARILQMN